MQAAPLSPGRSCPITSSVSRNDAQRQDGTAGVQSPAALRFTCMQPAHGGWFMRLRCCTRSLCASQLLSCACPAGATAHSDAQTDLKTSPWRWGMHVRPSCNPMPARDRQSWLKPWVETPTKLLTEVRLAQCGSYPDRLSRMRHCPWRRSGSHQSVTVRLGRSWSRVCRPTPVPVGVARRRGCLRCRAAGTHLLAGGAVVAAVHPTWCCARCHRRRNKGAQLG